MLLVWRNVIELEQVPLQTKQSIVESITSKRDFYRKNFLLIEPIIERMYTLYPDNAKVVDSYITHLIAGNRVEEALVMLKRKMSAVEQPTIEQLDRIIEIEYYINRTDSVEVYLDRGIALYPTHENFWTFKSWLQTQRGDNEGSIQTLNAALKYAKDDKARSSIWGSIGDRYYEMGELKRSDKIYKKAIALDPENVMALNNYAYHMSVEGKNLEYALTLSTKVNKLAPNNATYLDTLAWIYYKLGKYEEAKKIMQQAMSFDKQGSAELALHYGDILDALGNTFLAQTYWRKALERGCAADIIERRIEAQKRRLEENKEVTK
jgi:tetratricopeptide (TPR) repeat protein